MDKNISNETPVAMLTLGQLKDALFEGMPKPEQREPAEPPKSNKYIYGLRGIRQLFGVSHATAQRYKDTILKDAVKQCGRKIVVDADLALELFNKKGGR